MLFYILLIVTFFLFWLQKVCNKSIKNTLEEDSEEVKNKTVSSIFDNSQTHTEKISSLTDTRKPIIIETNPDHIRYIKTTNDERLEISLNVNKNDLTRTEICLKSDNDIKNEHLTIITTGENEFYKELLQDSRWISLRDSIKKRDCYTCQNCYNTIKIEHLEKLKNMHLPINQEVMDYIINSFPKLKEMFRDDDTEEEIHFDWERSSYIPRYDIYRYDIDSVNVNIVDLYSGLTTYPPILTSLDPSELLTGHIMYKDFDNNLAEHKFSTRCYYLKGNSTEGEIYISYFYGTIGSYNEKKYSAVLTLDEYSIVFPLTEILLEVHHLKYSKTGKPWDVSKSNLITLCHSCHMEAHKRPIPVE